MQVSNPDRMIFPDVGITKAEVVAYYETVAPFMGEFVLDRPLTLQRYPKGLSGKGFMQKNAPKHYPPSIERYPVPKSDGTTIYPVLTRTEDIPYLANQGTITFHVWLSTVARPMHPDFLVLDLDPPEDAAELVRNVALETRIVLDSFGIPSIPVATGSKGFHIWIPLNGTHDYGSVGRSSHALAGIVAAKVTDKATLEFLKKERRGRVFVDWLRNHQGATVATPFSIRPRARASVAMPLTWKELETAEPDQWTITTIDDRLNHLPTWPDPVDLPIDLITKAATDLGIDVDARFDRFGRDL